MVHSFNVIENKNGNTTVQFYQDNKLRQIIFTKNTEAQKDFHTMRLISKRAQPDRSVQDDIIYLRKKYLFKANANNPSIFRPIAKSLILKTH